jgi:hypothetical protein
MNVRKAQKHMQRATELLNRGQLGFGSGDDTRKRAQKRSMKEEDLIIRTRSQKKMEE